MSYALLLVDDDTEVLSINRKFFEQYGYEVYTAEMVQRQKSKQMREGLTVQFWMS